MNHSLISFIFYNLTRALMTMLVCGSIYLLRTIVHMTAVPTSALRLYHSLPLLAEHIIAGVLVYTACALLFTWAASQETV